jgi:hypothetical protein
MQDLNMQYVYVIWYWHLNVCILVHIKTKNMLYYLIKEPSCLLFISGLIHDAFSISVYPTPGGQWRYDGTRDTTSLTHQQNNCSLWGPPRSYITRSSWECQFERRQLVGSAQKLIVEGNTSWSQQSSCVVLRSVVSLSRGTVLEFGGSGPASRRPWALARTPWAERYSVETAVRVCSPRAVRAWGIAWVESCNWTSCEIDASQRGPDPWNKEVEEPLPSNVTENIALCVTVICRM